MKNFTLKLFSFLLLFAGAKTMSAETVEWVASAQGYANGQDVIEFDIDDVVSVTADKGSNKSNGPKYYNTGNAWRLYGGNTMTINSGSAKISEIVFTFATGDGTNSIEVDKGSFDKDTWNGSESEITFTIGGTTGHRRIAKITVTYSSGEVVSVKRPTITPGTGTYTEPQLVKITAEDGLKILYSFDNVTYNYYYGPFTVSETTTIYACAEDKDGNKSSSVSATITIVDLGSLNGSGALADPYDVASALKIILAGVAPTDKVYVKGIISKIDQVETEQYGNATYYISDDGTTTNQLEVFRGFYINGEQFTDANQIKVGDNVTVWGVLVYYNNTTPEFTSGSQITEHNGDKAVEVPTVTPASGVYSESQTVTISVASGLKAYYSFDNETFNEYTNSFSVAETTTIYAYAEDAKGTKSATVEVTININNGTASGDGTADNPYNVTAALNLIKSGTIPADEVYVKGKISKIDQVNLNYGDATYFISNDASVTAGQLKIFQGKYFDKANFTKAEQIAIEDEVVICGKLAYYENTTAEMDKGNYIYMLNGSTTPPAAATYKTIAAAKAAATADKVTVKLELSNVLVTYVNGQSTYIADATDGFLLFGKNIGMTTGQVVNVSVTGELHLYNGLPELAVSKVETPEVVSEGNEITPTVVEITDLKDNPMKYSNMLVQIEDVTYDTAEFTDRNVTIYQEGEDAVVRDNWNVATTAVFDTDKDDYTVIGFVAIYTKDGSTTIQLYPRKLEDLGLEKEQYTPVGDGSEENPYTVTDVLHLWESGQVSEEVWVKGYIVGLVAGTTIDKAIFAAEGEGAVASNVIIADDASTTNIKSCIPVNLPTDPKDEDGNTIPNIRAKVNLVDNPGNLGKEVKFLGKYQDYFKVAGLKDVKDAIIDGEHANGIIDVNADAVASKGIYNIAGQRINSITRGGMYIINGKKVLVK